MYRSRGNCVMASPLTTAKGISTCSGDTITGAAGAGLDTTIFRSGFTIPPCKSSGPQMHRAPHVIERPAGHFARLLAALDQNTGQHVRVVLEFLRTFAHAVDLFEDALDQRLLAVETTDASGAASLIDPLACRVIRIKLVQVPHWTLLRIARVGATHARRIGLHRPKFRGHGVRVLAHADGIAIRLRHLAAIEPGYPGRCRQQRLRLSED